MATGVVFGAFMPQGWKMELSGIDGAEAKWDKAVEIALLAEAARLRLDLGLRPLPQRAATGPRGGLRVLDDDRRDQPAHQPDPPRPDGGLQLVPGAGAAGQDHVDDRRDLRRPPRLGHRRRLVRARVQGLRLRVPAARRIASACSARCVEIVKSMWTRARDDVTTGKYYETAAGQLRSEAAAAAPPADLDRRRRRAAHAAGRGPPRRLLQLRRPARRVGATSARSCKAHCADGRPRRRRDPQDLVARGVHPLDRGRDAGGRQPQRVGTSRSTSWRAGNLVGTPEQVCEKIQTYVDLGCTGFIPWCARLPRHRDDDPVRHGGHAPVPLKRRSRRRPTTSACPRSESAPNRRRIYT